MRGVLSGPCSECIACSLARSPSPSLPLIEMLKAETWEGTLKCCKALQT